MHIRFVLGATVTSLVLTAGSDALASEDETSDELVTPPPREATKENAPSVGRWYGWQTLLVDGAALGAFVAAPPAGVAIYALVPPALHAAHKNTRSMVLSLVFRFGAPIVMGAAGFGVGELIEPRRPGDDTWGLSGGLALFGFLGGMASAQVVDIAWLSRESNRVDASPGPAPPSEPLMPAVGVRVSPSFAATPRGDIAIGAVGTF